MARLWILLLLLAASCDGAGVARVEFELPEPRPDRTLYATVRVEERSDRVTALGGEGPIELEPSADRLAFESLSIPHGDDRVLIAELSASPDRDVLWYGVSAPFSLHAGDEIAVLVKLTQQPPLENRVAIRTDTPGFVRTSTVELELSSDRGVRALISNSQNFPDADAVELTGAPLPWTMDAELCAGMDGCSRTVFVRFIDTNGYQSRTATASIVVDTQPPQLFGAAGVRLFPDAANPLREITRARAGTEVQVSLPLSEPLSAPPSVFARGGDAAIPFERCEGSGLSWLCTLTFPASAALEERSYLVDAQARDRAGNLARGLFVGVLIADSLPPAPPDTDCDGCLVYHRTPFGADRGFTVTSSAGAALPGEVVAIFDAADEEIGRSAPAAEDGSFAAIRLTTTDRPRVYAAAIDGAGNRSAARTIRNMIATASFGGEPGNPSRVLQDPRFEAFGRDRREGSYSETSLPDGGTVQSIGGYTWREVTLRSRPPPARENRSVVWDPVRDRAVMFGGLSATGELLNDHWEWDGFTWEEIDVGSRGPKPRELHTLVADVARSQLLLFGGRDSAGHSFGDTWTFKDGVWSEYKDGGPHRRLEHAMVYDPIRGQVILTGGFDLANPPTFFQDTWVWDGQWTPRNPAHPPSRGGNRSAAFDYQRGVIVLFGGGRRMLDEDADVWEWDGADWRHALPASAPLARRKATLVYHPQLSAMLMFGGNQLIGANQEVILSDAHTWDGTNWSPFSLAMPGRTDASMFLDPNRGEVYAFGGDPALYDYADLSAVRGDGSIEALDRIADPSGRTHAAMTADPLSGEPLLFGGEGGLSGNNEWIDDLWRFERSQWVQIPSSGPPPLAWPSMATDPVRQIAILTGLAPSPIEPQTWMFDGAAWSQLPDARPPTIGGGLAYAPGIAEMIFFGGLWESDFSAEQWQLSGAGWTPLAGSVLSPRAYHAMVTDPLRSRALLIGGVGSIDVGYQLWSWSGAWTPLQPSLQERCDLAATFDPALDRLLLFGGGTCGNAVADLESWDPATDTWRSEPTPSTQFPRPRDGASMQYDAASERTLLFGGCASTGCGNARSNDDTWLLEHRPNERPAVVLIADLGASKVSRREVRSVGIDVASSDSDIWIWGTNEGRWTQASGASSTNEWIDDPLQVHVAVLGRSGAASVARARVSIEYRVPD